MARRITDEMHKWNLIDDGWTWAWDNGKRRMGCCDYVKRRLTFSRHLFRINTEDRNMETVRHEIAHALAGAAAGHGPQWKAWAVRCGAPPRARYTHENTNKVQAKWHGTCECKTWERHRLSQKVRQYGTCPACKVKITWRQNRRAA